MSAQRRTTILISIVGALAVTTYAVWAAVHILVLNPLAAAPGRDLKEIHGAMADAGESFSMPWVLVILGFGVALAVTSAWVCIATRVPPIVAASGPLVLLMMGAPGYFIASFAPGMALADTLGISGGAHAPGALPLYAVSAFAGIVSIVLGIAASVRSRQTAVTI